MLLVLLLTAGLLCVSAGQAWALTNNRVASISDVPMGGVYLDNVRHSNLTVTVNGASQATMVNKATGGASTNNDRVLKAVKVSGAGNHANPCSYFWRNAGQTVYGERIDMRMTCTNVRVAYEDGHSGAVTFVGAYDGGPDFFTFAASLDGGSDWYQGTANHGFVKVWSDWKIELFYTGTDRVVSVPYVMIVDDLDFSWDGLSEGVTFKSGWSGDAWIKQDSVLKISGNTYSDDPDWAVTNTFNFECGVAAKTVNGSFSMQWQGRGCGTTLTTDVTHYPDDYIGTPTKTVETTEPVGLGEQVKFTVNQFVPYAPANVATQQVKWTDTLDRCLDASSAVVKVVKLRDAATAADTDVTSRFNVTKNGQTITVSHKTPNSSGGTYRVEITAKVRSDADFSGYATEGHANGGSYWKFSNKAVGVVNSTSRETNTVWGKAWYGSLTIIGSSANDRVSQLGQNGCYTLAGARYEVFADEACTVKVGEGVTDGNGRVFIDRLNPGTYWVREVAPSGGFALNTKVGTAVVLGRTNTDVLRADVPQSEDLDGSIMSKRDKELASVGERLNPVQWE